MLSRIVKILSLFLGFLYLLEPVKNALTLDGLSPSWSPMVITSPTSLTPILDISDPLCKSFWYSFESNDGYPAYLTPNVSGGSIPAHSGEWQPNIPTTGFYKVEIYIPAHNQVSWNCEPAIIFNLDTSNASYIISSDGDVKTVSVNQAVNSGKWVTLGNFFLNKGVDSVLSLNNITGESNNTSLVSFSMARFTWVQGQGKIFIPMIYNNFDQASLTKVRLDNVVPYAREGISRTRFDMDELVTFRVSGTNGYTSSETTRLSWQFSSACGYSPETEISLLVPVGSWSYDLKTSIAACPGQALAIIRIYSRGAMLQKSVNLNVDGGATLQLFQGPAFDVCHLPSIDTMKAWWNSSPYSVVNIYMGGISFASGCNYSGLNRDWIKNVQNIGWGYIPTWVGPQAPCSDLKYKFSFDTTTAYNQGKQEAQSAATKAIQLGLVRSNNNDTIIYYDMEGYSYANNAKDPTIREQCKLAVKEFLRGWTEQLHNYEMLAGGYGGALSSYITEWWTISPRLDTVWAARWYTVDGQYFYDPLASVYNLGFSNDYWHPNKRVRQYAGDHYETWGGRQLAIDSDVADASLLMPRFRITKPPVAADPTFIESAAVKDFQLLNELQGWWIDQNSLYWTEDGGLSWKAINIPLPETAILEKGVFRSATEGWLVASSEAGFLLLTTDNRGASWEEFILPDYGPADPLEISFIDTLNGMIKFRFQTSQAFREGFMLVTKDGGISWFREELPQDDPAWQRGKPDGSAQPVPGQPSVPEGTIEVKWISSTEGWARVFLGTCSGSGEEAGYVCRTSVVLMKTTNAGEAWTQVYP